MTIDVDGVSAGEPIAVVPPRQLDVDTAWFSVPEAIEFPTADGAVAHAFYYPPRHPDVRGPDHERPPLLVFIHGGPTSAARVMLRLAYQYSTRGFAVVDVNYRGFDRLWPRLPQPTPRAVGRRRRRGLRGGCAGTSFEPRRCRSCPAVHPGRVGGWLHDARRAGLRRTSSRPAPVTTAIADLGTLASDTHKFESRYLDGLVGPWPEARDVYEGAVADLPRRRARSAAGGVPGPRRRGRHRRTRRR